MGIGRDHEIRTPLRVTAGGNPPGRRDLPATRSERGQPDARPLLAISSSGGARDVVRVRQLHSAVQRS